MYHLLNFLAGEKPDTSWKANRGLFIIQRALFLIKYLEGHFREDRSQLPEIIWVNGFISECESTNGTMLAFMCGDEEGGWIRPFMDPWGKNRTVCFRVPGFPWFCSCLFHLSSTLLHISPTLHASDIQETENKEDKVLKQLLYVTRPHQA